MAQLSSSLTCYFFCSPVRGPAQHCPEEVLVVVAQSGVQESTLAGVDALGRSGWVTA